MTMKHLTEDSDYDILSEFVSKFTRTLKDWWQTVAEADKLVFLTR